MRSLEEKITRFNKVAADVKNGPPNEVTQAVRKRLSDIRDLLIKADVAMDTGKSPACFFDRIDDVLDDIETINLNNRADQ